MFVLLIRTFFGPTTVSMDNSAFPADILQLCNTLLLVASAVGRLSAVVISTSCIGVETTDFISTSMSGFPLSSLQAGAEVGSDTSFSPGVASRTSRDSPETLVGFRGVVVRGARAHWMPLRAAKVRRRRARI